VAAEATRLEDDGRRIKNWKRWGPYLSERQWGTVREDYSEHGDCWSYFPHDDARSRAYRWGEDGLLGICDRECRLCFALALWNGRDPILKERLFGLTGPEGNHGEDVKECYYYLDSTPTHSYMRALYKYPQAAYPYETLVGENARRSKHQPELELLDTGIFDGDRYFDVFAEYAKASPDDVLIRVTAANRGPDAATLHILPTLWFRNTWSPGRIGDGYARKPSITRASDAAFLAEHETLGRFRFAVDAGPGGRAPDLLFCDNETNFERLYGAPNAAAHVKDAFHEYVIGGRREAVNAEGVGTKVAAHYQLEVPAGQQVVIRLRLFADEAIAREPFGRGFDATFADRRREADEFYAGLIPDAATDDERRVMRQGYAGLLWSKQFYHYIVRDWLEGDPAYPRPPQARLDGRNADWGHLFNRDVISMPDKWEYPWYAAWDLAFHMIPFAPLDPHFTKQQLVLFLREWYMHPNGQIPAYEFALGDVNPPVHAWACWRAYKVSASRGERDHAFLERAFHKLMLNFTWWVNRKDVEGKHLFAGGFLGLDNIGVFDRSQPLPGGGHLEQADGTAWMAFYSATMLAIALELARDNSAYEDVASKFFEHFVAIAEAMNQLGGDGLWHEEDGFYYDQLHSGDAQVALRIRSLVGIVPLFACELIDDEVMDRLPSFARRVRWFLENRPDLASQISCMHVKGGTEGERRLLAIPSRERLIRVLGYALDEREFLSPHGLRALSRKHADLPYILLVDGIEHRVDYVPAESNTGLFGGNSNWRGPVWFPLNYLLIEALERYHQFYGESLRVECPTGSGRLMNLKEVAHEISRRLAGLFLPDASGRRPCHGDERRYAEDPHWRDLVLFSEYFDGDTGRGVGASHQTGWTALAVRCVEDVARARASGPEVGQAAPPALIEAPGGSSR
jgi:hypothetical protein